IQQASRFVADTALKLRSPIMAMPERDSGYNADGTRKTVYTRDNNTSAGWIIGGIIVVALIVIAYFVFAGHPTTPSGVNSSAPATTSAPATPATPAPSDSGTSTTPATPAPSAPAT